MVYLQIYIKSICVTRKGVGEFMLLFIISLVIFVGGLFLLFVEDKFCFNGILYAISVLTTIIGSAALFVCSLFAIITVCTKNIQFEKATYEKEMLEYRLENQEENLVGGELLYNDILEFNNKLKSHKKYSKNLFTNWYYNDKIAEIDYIDHRKE